MSNDDDKHFHTPACQHGHEEEAPVLDKSTVQAQQPPRRYCFSCSTSAYCSK